MIGWWGGGWGEVKLGLPRWLSPVKNSPAVQENRVQSLGWEDPLEKGMATHSSILGESDGQGNLAGYIVHRVAFGSLGCLWFRVQFNVRQSVGHD